MRILAALCMTLAALAATSQDVAGGAEAGAKPAGDKSQTIAKVDPAAPVDDEFEPPPGFKTRKRGELVLYCMRDSTVGTRFKTEKCYDEAQMRDYLAAQQENKRDIERVRNTCSTGAGEYCRRQ
jgi:hypothetical protein